MSKRNAALDALAASPPPANVVELGSKTEAPAEPRPVRKTVANSTERSMLYLPPKVKRKFKEIAFYESRKEHDVYIEALREYLENRGHKGLL
jgi:hypothetical protein